MSKILNLFRFVTVLVLTLGLFPVRAYEIGKLVVSYQDGTKRELTLESLEQCFPELKAFIKEARDGRFDVGVWLGGSLEPHLSVLSKGGRIKLDPEGSWLTAEQALTEISKAEAAGVLNACASNLERVRMEVSVWKKAHPNQLPTSLKQLDLLVPEQACPTGRPYVYKPGSKGRYRVECQGNHEQIGVPKGYPFADEAGVKLP